VQAAGRRPEPAMVEESRNDGEAGNRFRQ